MSRHVAGHITVRPVRIGLAIAPESWMSFARAVELNTFMWGGMFNPILRSVDPDDLLSGTEAFDLDVVYPVDGDPAATALSNRPGYSWRGDPTVGPFGWESSFLDDFTPMTVEPLISTMDSSETIHLTWDPEHPLAALLLCVYGRFGSGVVESRVGSAFSHSASKTVELSASDGIPLVSVSNTQLGLSMVDLRLWGRPGAGVAIVDPHSLSDLVAFWNIRAAGADVVPVPIGYLGMIQESLLSWLQGHEQEDWAAWPDGRRVVSVFSRNQRIPEDVDALLVSALPNGLSMMVDHLDVMPRPDPVSPPNVRSQRGRAFDIDIDDDAGFISVSMPSVEFLPRRSWDDRFGIVAADVRAYTEWDMPAGRRLSVPRFRGFADAMGVWQSPLNPFMRPLGDGITIGTEVSREMLAVPVASSIQLVTSLFRSQGYDVSISSSGRHVARLIELLGGAHEDSLANQPAVRSVLRKAGSTPSGEPIAALEGIAKRDSGEWPSKFGSWSRSTDYPKEVVNRLAMRKALVPRLKLSCFSCGTTSVYSADDLAADVTCELCGDTHPLALYIAVQNPRWQLATARTLPSSRVGETVPVMATISVMSAVVSPHARELPHYSLGVELAKGDFKCEVDIVFCLSSHGVPVVVLTEVKGYKDPFDQNDFANLRSVQIAARSAGIEAYLLFATLRDSLEDEEVAGLRNLADDWMWPISAYPSGHEAPSMPIVLTNQALSVDSWHDGHPQKWAGRSVSELAVESCRRELGFTGLDHRAGEVIPLWGG